jgi:hypothetical protein
MSGTAAGLSGEKRLSLKLTDLLIYCIIASLRCAKAAIIRQNYNETKKEAVPAVNTGKKKKIVEGVQYRLLSLLCFVLIIGFWCVASYGHLVQEVFLPSPTAVLSRLVSMAADGSLWAHCRESIARVMIG